MKVLRRISTTTDSASLFVKVALDPNEMEVVRRFGMLEFAIRTGDGPFGGRLFVPRTLKGSFRDQLGKVKGRWSAGLVASSGLVAFDFALVFFGFLIASGYAIVRQLIGTRPSFRQTIDGLSINSTRLVDIKEADFHIMISLAAISSAIQYASQIGSEKVYDIAEVFLNVEGLDFAGAPAHAGGSGFFRVLRIVFAIILAVLAAIISTGARITETFGANSV